MPTRYLARHFFVRCCALIFFAAFLSMFLQNPGLIGSHGLLPAQNMVDEATRLLPEAWKRPWIFPTFCWLSASDASLTLQCLLGIAASLAALAGFAPGCLMTVCWALYLSMVHAGQEFYRWPFDSLLLECGLLASILSPWRWAWFRPDPSREAPPAPWETALALSVLGKCLLLPGLGHLTLGDSAWPTLTALSLHTWTQPLPTALSLLLAQVAPAILKVLTAMVLIAELATPFLLPFTPRVRRLAFFPVLFLALGSAWTGESVWTGALLLALGLWVLDDAAFPKRLGGTLLPAPPEIPLAPRLSLGRKVALGLYSLVLGVTSLGFFFGLLGFQPLGAAGNGVYRAVYPLRSFNAYLPERAIPSDRLGLVLEGTRDGREWKPYRFPAEPSEGPRRPAMARWALHRLDYQMSLAARKECQDAPFLAQLCASLVEGRKVTHSLVKEDPFSLEPPLAVRVRKARLRLASPNERRDKGVWWMRDIEGEFCPEIRLPR